MPKAMRLWDLNRALQRQKCEVKSDAGRHTKWICPCGEHSANIPRHRVISPGVVKTTIQRLGCLPEGWLQ